MDLNDNLGKPSMPIALFNSELVRVLDSNYNTGIYNTGKKVADRLVKYYKKPMADGFT